MNNICRWIDTVMENAYERNFILDYLINKHHITEISSLYCDDIIKKILSEIPEGSLIFSKIQIFFIYLISQTKKLDAVSFLKGFGFDEAVSKKIIDSGYDAVSKIKEVNYEQLLNIGIEENKAKEFVEKMLYSVDEIDILIKRFGDFK